MSKYTQPMLDKDYRRIVELLVEEFDPELMIELDDVTPDVNIFLFRVLGGQLRVSHEVGDIQRFSTLNLEVLARNNVLVRFNERFKHIQITKNTPDYVLMFNTNLRYKKLTSMKEEIMHNCELCRERLEGEEEQHYKYWDEMNCEVCLGRLEERMDEVDSNTMKHISDMMKKDEGIFDKIQEKMHKFTPPVLEKNSTKCLRIIVEDFQNYLDILNLEYSLYDYHRIRDNIKINEYVGVEINTRGMPFLTKSLFDMPVSKLVLNIHNLNDRFVNNSYEIPEDIYIAVEFTLEWSNNGYVELEEKYYKNLLKYNVRYVRINDWGNELMKQYIPQLKGIEEIVFDPIDDPNYHKIGMDFYDQLPRLKRIDMGQAAELFPKSLLRCENLEEIIFGEVYAFPEEIPELPNIKRLWFNDKFDRFPDFTVEAGLTVDEYSRLSMERKNELYLEKAHKSGERYKNWEQLSPPEKEDLRKKYFLEDESIIYVYRNRRKFIEKCPNLEYLIFGGGIDADLLLFYDKLRNLKLLSLGKSDIWWLPLDMTDSVKFREFFPKLEKIQYKPFKLPNLTSNFVIPRIRDLKEISEKKVAEVFGIELDKWGDPLRR